MARKAMWMVLLLGALLALSVSAVFAANVTHTAPTVLAPETHVLRIGSSTGVSKGVDTEGYAHGDCPFSKTDSAAAY